MKKNLLKFKTGFTLVESLVAVAILSLSIAGTFTAVQIGLKTSIAAKNQITAFYLAQEALEFIKNVRDNNALHSLDGTATDWMTSLSAISTDPCYSDNICRIDTYDETITRCGASFGSCPNLNQDTSTGRFSYTSGGTWIPTSFKREVKIHSTGSDSVDVTINIQWTSGGDTKSFQVTGAVFKRQ